MDPRRAALCLVAAAAALLLASAVAVDARSASRRHSGRSLKETKSSVTAAIKAARAKAEKAEKLAGRLSARSPPRLKQCLDICRENFESAVDSLDTADKYLHGGGDHMDMMTELSAAVTAVETCNEAFEEDPGLHSPITDMYVELRGLVATSLNKGAKLH